MKKILTFVLVPVLVLAVLAGLGFAINRKAKDNSAEMQFLSEFQKQAPIEIPDSSITSIQEIKDKEKPVIAMFYVDWCTYCRRFMPVFGEAAKAYSDKYNFAAVHCEKPENLGIVEEYGISGFPSVYIIEDKINYAFPLPNSSTRDLEAFTKQLDKYTEARKHFTK